jgi:hypothetical protein
MDLTPNSIWRKFINDEFMMEKYSDFRNWFFKKFPTWEREKIKEDYYDYLNESQNFVRIVKWFITYFLNKTENEVLTLKSRPWNVVGHDEPIQNPFPPEQGIILGKDIEAIAYTHTIMGQRVGNTQINLQELNSIIKAQNFSNAYLTRIGDQLISLDKDLSFLKCLVEKQYYYQKSIIEKFDKKESQPPKGFYEKISETPIIQPPTKIEGFKIDDNSNEFLNTLQEKLKKLNLNVLSKDGDSDCDSKESHDNHDEVDDIDQLTTMFADYSLNDKADINTVYTKRAIDKIYYDRPSPQDLLFEENEDIVQNSYSGRSIYEWNIDGLNDRQIVTVTQKMLMYATICKQQGNPDRNIAIFITVGFVGQLRGWWDFYLNEVQKEEILSH